MKIIAQKLITLILVSILLLHNINTLVIVANFIANQDFIAKTLCVQKDNQQGCNGKCHLRKQLAQNEIDTKGTAPIQENKRIALDVFFVSEINAIKKQCVSSLSVKHNLFYRLPILSENMVSVEIPPPNIF